METIINGIDKENTQFYHKGKKYVHYSGLKHNQTAFFRFSLLQKCILLIIVALAGFAFYQNWHLSIVIFIAVLSLFLGFTF